MKRVWKNTAGRRRPYTGFGVPHAEALHLIPRELRQEFEKEYNVYIEGELCLPAG